MKFTRFFGRGRPLGWSMILAALLFLTIPQASMAQTLALSAVGSDGQPAGNFRWLVEEDTTWHVAPGVPQAQILGTGFQKSYAPVVAKGDQGNLNVVLDPLKHYFVSVLPESGYNLGGAPVAPGQTAVNVIVDKMPLPTAQIVIIVYEDKAPLNNQLDQPEELGLEGFEIFMDEPGGRYGASGGAVMLDAFGNMIGTTYNPDGSVAMMGTGKVYTDANGMVIIKNLYPGKYGIQVIPPANQGWTQTSTIEGTRVVDAWVKADEPAYFQEFGPPGYHVEIGFTRPFTDATVLNGGNTVSGQVVNMHMSRPPDYRMWPGHPIPGAWVGLNDIATGKGRAVYCGPADPDTGEFSIPNVPAGTYQLVFWDKYLLNIFAFQLITVTGGQDLALGQVPVFRWFCEIDNVVFNDLNENGFRDPGEPPMANQNINLRWRDGTIYQLMPTDVNGESPFEAVFPFFAWQVAEVDFARFKATGATITVDAGGQIDPANPWSFDGKLNPQMQEDPNNPGQFLPYRTEVGPVLTQGFQVFLGQTNVIQWGKTGYAPGENGGISGVIQYAVTRAEDDPRIAFAENWEPGIPRVQVNLYADGDIDNVPCGNFPSAEDLDWNGNGVFDVPDGVIQDVNRDGAATLADVDNFPFGWKDGGARGPEDQDRDDPLQQAANAVFDPGDAIQIATSDSWDDNQPTGCIPDNPANPFSLHGLTPDCYDGLRNFNQVRPAVFDGGYAFNSYVAGGVASGLTPTEGLPSGVYIVEAVAPPGYEHQKEEDKNVDFGQEYTPSMLELPPVCVGDLRRVPDFLSLLPGIPARYAGQLRPLPDRKQVWVRDAYNAAANFFLFTEVPIAAHVVGFILDDTANEFDPNAPTFGEKYAPSWVPVSFHDWTGREITRVYSDEYGNYNALLPSTFSANLPVPSGFAPNMITACMNQRMMPDPNNPGRYIEDPHYNPQYSQFCYTFQYMPGVTTYLDTPVLPVAAFAGPGDFPLDAELPPGTPVIKRVDGPDGGPYAAQAGEAVTIQSMGTVQVPNPVYDGAGGLNPKLVDRDFGFGVATGKVFIDGVEQAVSSWDNNQITFAAENSGQLMIQRGDNNLMSVVGLTMTVGGDGNVLRVGPTQAYKTIQAAIDAAGDGDLVLVEPGVYYELVILYRDIRLQGYGAGSTTIDAVKVPAEKLIQWRQKAESLLNAGLIRLLPGQNKGFVGIEPGTLQFEEGAGVTVLHKDAEFEFARVDGFTVSGGDGAGGIIANGYCTNLSITNNKVEGNQGFLSGGIRVGHPDLVDNQGFVDALNYNVTVAYNHVAMNSGLEGAGGIAIGPGSDNYRIVKNYIVGNYAGRNGGGIGHSGYSANGLIEDNLILFNESFYQASAVHGGGIAIEGNATLPVAVPQPGSGSVVINRNIIQGNLAGAGDGGGIWIARTNQADVFQAIEPEPTPGDDPPPGVKFEGESITITNNQIVDNVAGLAGGGILLQDAVFVDIINNTIANNDSTATAGLAFTNGPNVSVDLPAGIVSRAHSAGLKAYLAASDLPGVNASFSDPFLVNNIIYQNRQFHYDTSLNGNTGGLAPDLANGAAAVYADLAVLGAGPDARLNPRYCLLTDITGYEGNGNVTGDPGFVASYHNGGRSEILILEFTTGISVAAALDEGGNFIDLDYGPLTRFNPTTGELFGDYHITGGPAVNTGTDAFLAVIPQIAQDFDLGDRPQGAASDMGADELGAAQPLAADAGYELSTGSAASKDSGSASCFLDSAQGNANGKAPGLVLLVLAGLAGLCVAFRRVPAGLAGLLVLVLLMGGASAPSHAYLRFQCPPDTDGVDTDGDGIVDNDNNCIQVGAGDGFVTMADGVRQYCFGFSDLNNVPMDMLIMKGMLAATAPSPTIFVKEGQKVYLNLTNVGMMIRPDLPDPHTVHWHGFPQAASIFDGVPDDSISINMGSTLTYFYNVVEPGTFLYHCHVEATEHMQMGMMGNLYVWPKQNNLPDGTNLAGFIHRAGYKYAYNDGDGSTYYDVEVPMQITGFDPDFHWADENFQPLPFAAMDDRYPMFNGRGYPDTVNTNPIYTDMTDVGGMMLPSQPMNSLITATAGEKILLRFSSVSTMHYVTVGTAGLSMRVVGEGSRLLRGPDGKDLSYETTSVRLGGGEAMDAIIDTTGAAPGVYPLFAQNLQFLSNDGQDFGGLMTEIVIKQQFPPVNVAATGMPADYTATNPATWPVLAYAGTTTFTATGGQGANYGWDITKPDATTQALATTANTLSITAQEWKNMVAASGAGVYTVSVMDMDNPRQAPALFIMKAPVFIEPMAPVVQIAANAAPMGLTLVGAPPDGVLNYTWSFADLNGNPVAQATAEAGFGTLNPYASSDPVTGNLTSLDPLNTLTVAMQPLKIRAVVNDPALAALGLNQASTGAVSVIPMVDFTVNVEDVLGNPLAGATVTATFNTNLTAVSNGAGQAVIPGLANTGATWNFVVTLDGYNAAQISATNLSLPVNATLSQIAAQAFVSGTVTPVGNNVTVQAQAANGSWVVDGNGATITVTASPATGAYTLNFDLNLNAAGPYAVFAFQPGFITNQAEGQGVATAAVNTAGNNIAMTPVTALSATSMIFGGDVRFNITATPAFNNTAGEIQVFAGTDATGTDVTGSLAWTGTGYQYSVPAPAVGETVSIFVRADASASRSASAGYFVTRGFSYVTGLTGTSEGMVANPSVTGGSTTSASGNVTVTIPSNGLTGPAMANVQVNIDEYDATQAGITTMGGSPLLFDVTLIDPATGLVVDNANIAQIFITLSFDPNTVTQGSFESGAFKIYQATDMAALLAGQGVPVPVPQIVNVDYVAGKVTFWVSHLSAFGIGAATAAPGGGTATGGSDSGTCFIGASGSAGSLAGVAMPLLMLASAASMALRRFLKD